MDLIVPFGAVAAILLATLLASRIRGNRWTVAMYLVVAGSLVAHGINTPDQRMASVFFALLAASFAARDVLKDHDRLGYLLVARFRGSRWRVAMYLAAAGILAAHGVGNPDQRMVSVFFALFATSSAMQEILADRTNAR